MWHLLRFMVVSLMQAIFIHLVGGGGRVVLLMGYVYIYSVCFYTVSCSRMCYLGDSVPSLVAVLCVCT